MLEGLIVSFIYLMASVTWFPMYHFSKNWFYIFMGISGLVTTGLIFSTLVISGTPVNGVFIFCAIMMGLVIIINTSTISMMRKS